MNINGSAEAGTGYHGFWSKDITQLNPYFGTADDLKALSKALHDRDMVRFRKRFEICYSASTNWRV